MESSEKAIPDLVVVPHRMPKVSEPEPGLTRRVLAYNEKLFLVEHEFAKGWSGTVHRHPYDQIVYVLHGHRRIHCQTQKFDIRAGDAFAVREGLEHGASALEDSLVVDAFTQCREDCI